MKRCSLFLIAMCAYVMPVLAADRWLDVVTSRTGYEFRGKSDNVAWTFDVPGRTIETTENRGRAFAHIDDVVVQVFTMRASQFAGENVLLGHRKYESDYLERMGAAVGPSNICALMAIPHQEWEVVPPKGAQTAMRSVYLTFVAKHQVVIIAVAGEAAAEPEAKRKLRAICSSLTLDAAKSQSD